MTQNKPRRFGSPEVLTEATKCLGMTAGEWDKVFTENFKKNLILVKERAEAVGLPVPTNCPKKMDG